MARYGRAFPIRRRTYGWRPASSDAVAHEATASGASTTSGSAAATLGLAATASGASTSSGSAAAELVHPASASGASTTSGSAAALLALLATASGAGTTTGSAVALAALLAASAGTATSDGSAAALLALEATASGTSSSSGTAAAQYVHPATASGTSTTTGSAAATLTLPVTASGQASSMFGRLYAFSTGGRLEAPDVAAFTPGTTLDVRVHCALLFPTAGAYQCLMSKSWTAGNRGWFFGTASGVVQLWWSHTGSDLYNATATVLHGVGENLPKWFRALAVLAPSGNYDVRFYLSDDGVTYTQLGSARVGTTGDLSIYDSTGPLDVGEDAGGANERWGDTYRAELRVDGSVVATPDPGLATAFPYTDAQGNVWSTAGSITHEPGGRANAKLALQATASGTSSSSGSAAALLAAKATASGTATSSGSAVGLLALFAAASGSATSSGSASGLLATIVSTSGASSTSGAASATLTLLVTAAGAAVSSGSATATVISLPAPGVTELEATYSPTVYLLATYAPTVELEATYAPAAYLPATYVPAVALEATYDPTEPVMAEV